MSRRVDFETVLKDKFFYFKSEEGNVAVTTATEFGQKYTAKWGVQIVGMIFQPRSNTTKSEAGIWKNCLLYTSDAADD